jgi:hypothetical protein
MKQFEFVLRISSQQYLQYYRGAVRQILAQSTTGATVQIPAGLLTPFVTSGGISGRFVLTCEDSGRGAELRRIAG